MPETAGRGYNISFSRNFVDGNSPSWERGKGKEKKRAKGRKSQETSIRRKFPKLRKFPNLSRTYDDAIDLNASREMTTPTVRAVIAGRDIVVTFWMIKFC